MKKTKLEKLNLSIETISELSSDLVKGGSNGLACGPSQNLRCNASARDACPSNRVCTSTQIKTKCDA